MLAVTLLVALAVGAAASLLIGAATASGSVPTASFDLGLSSIQFAVLLALIGAGILVAWIAALVISAPGGGTSNLVRKFALRALIILLVAALFVTAARVLLVGSPTPAGEVTNPAGTNATANSTVSGPNNSTFLHGWNLTPFAFPGLPAWAPYLVIVGVLVIVIVFVGPVVWSWSAGRREARAVPRGRQRTVGELRGALESAAVELEGGASDPRTVIVRLYGTLLARLEPMVGSVDARTPEEIRAQHLARLGIRRDAATRLTRLFEEARYSSHPLGPETVVEARAAIREALEDLARAGGR